MSVHTRVLVLIIVEPDGFSLRTGELRSTLGQDCGFQVFHRLATLRGTLVESRQELLVVDLASSSLLAFSKDQIDVRVRAFLVYHLTVLGHLSESLAVHLGAIGELSEDFLQAACCAT